MSELVRSKGYVFKNMDFTYNVRYNVHFLVNYSLLHSLFDFIGFRWNSLQSQILYFSDRHFESDFFEY